MRELEAGDGRIRILGPAFLGILVGILAVLVAALVATLLLFLGWDWAAHLHVVGMTIAFAAVALGGFYAGARAGARGWLVGLIAGAFLVLVCYLLCLATGAEGMTGSLAVLRAFLACLIGAVGGALGVNFGAR
ncbi:MAG: TIGR04086 family membrane protein [Patescibacteria group bacterium]